MYEELEIPETRALLSYDETYDISPYGDVVNSKTGHVVQHSKVKLGHHRVDIHGRHMLVHRLVWQVFGDHPLGKGEQVNHYDDNKENNCITNLYAGTQKDNIADCIRNGHRKGNLKELVVRKKGDPVRIRFEMAKDFFDFAGKPCPKNGGIGRTLTRDWFKDEYELVYFGKASDRKV